MDLNTLISLIGTPGSIEAIFSIIKNIKNYIAKFYIAKNAIDSAIFDLYFNGIDAKFFDEITKKEIEELLNDKEQTLDIKMLIGNIESLLKEKGLNDEQAKIVSFIVVENFIKESSKYDTNGSLLQKLHLGFNEMNIKIEKILNDLNKFNNIKSLNEIEKEITYNVRNDSTIKNFDLRYFKIDDTVFKHSFDEFLNNNETELKVACFIKEEAIYCILNYLKYEKGYDKVYVVYDEETWDKLQINDLRETILIPYFVPKNYYKLQQGLKQIFLYTKDEENIDGYSIELRKRTHHTLNEILKNEYELGYREASKLVDDTNGNYYLIKNKVFVHCENLYDNDSKMQRNHLLLLMFINSISNIKEDNEILLNYLNMDFDSLIDAISKSNIYKRMFKIVVKYNIKCICLLDAKNIWQKYKIYENLDIEKCRKIYYTVILNNNYSSVLKQGLLKSFALLKFYTDNRYLCDDIVKLILEQVSNGNDWEKYYELLDMCIEINSNIVINRIYDEITLSKDTGLLNYFKDTDNQVYYKILWLIEKSLYLCEDIEKSLECLFILSECDYKNSGNNPKEIIRKLLFPGMPRPKKFIECKSIIENISKEYTNIDIWDICYSNINGGISFAWNTPKVANFHEEISEDVSNEFWDIYNMALELSNKPVQIIKLLDRGLHLKRNYGLLNCEISKLKAVIKNSDDAEKTYLYYRIKEMIYHYKYFKDEPNWEIDNTIIDELDSLSESIEFNNKIYKYLVYFSNPNDYVLISPVTFKDDKHFDKNNCIAEQYKKKVLDEIFWVNNDLNSILKIYITLISKKDLEFNTCNFTLGYDIATYKDKKNFSKNTIDILFKNFLNEEYELYRTIFDYIYAVKYDKEMVDCLLEYSIDYFEKNKKLSIGIIKILFRNGLNLDIIDKLPCEIQNEFWKDTDVLIFDTKTIDYKIIDKLFSKLKDNKNYYAYLEILELNQRNLNNEKIIKYLKELLEINEESIKEINKSKIAYLLSELFKDNNTNMDDDLNYLSDIELKFLRDYYTYDFRFSKLLFSNKPELYAEYVLKYFWVKDENNIEERQKIFLEKISNKFKMNLNTIAKYDDLIEWSEKFKQKIEENVNHKLRKKDINKFCSKCMGEIIAMSTNEVDGTFPLDIFKKFIEHNYNSDLEEVIVNTKYNLRGIYTPMQGEYNLSLCNFYEKSIVSCIDKYPKTIKILDRLRKIYYQEYKDDRRLSENANY